MSACCLGVADNALSIGINDISIIARGAPSVIAIPSPALVTDRLALSLAQIVPIVALLAYSIVRVGVGAKVEDCG